MHRQGHRDRPVADTLRDLLAHLPLWQQERDRRAFLDFALPGHPALTDFQYGGQPLTVASELVTRLQRQDYAALADGTHPVCALIHEVRTRGDDGNRATAERIGVLARFFDCDPPPRVAITGSPYPGLMAYDWGQDPDLARLFFGREPETLDLVERLRCAPAGGLLIVSGASGSGKSSLVKAGLWRALAEPPAEGLEPTPEPIPGCRDWLVSAMTPALDGDAFLTLVNSVRGATGACARRRRPDGCAPTRTPSRTSWTGCCGAAPPGC